MLIIYKDDYDVELFRGNTGFVPNAGDLIVINDEDWMVVNRVFHPNEDRLEVILKEPLRVRVQKESTNSDRLTQLSNSIIGISGRQESTEKKTRMLAEQISIIRKHINSAIREDKKKS